MLHVLKSSDVKKGWERRTRKKTREKEEYIYIYEICIYLPALLT